MNRINKKQVLFWIIVFLLISIIAFDRLFYSHKNLFLKKENLNLTDLPSVIPSLSLIPEGLPNVKEDVIDPIVEKVTTPISSQKTNTNQIKITVATTTQSSSATTTVVSIFKPVLPPESPTDYKDNGNGTITDNYTKLMWAKCTQGNTGKDCKSGTPIKKEWSKARDECLSSKLAGKTGWRLPTLKELEFIVDSGSFSPSINKTFFPNTSSEQYWTATAPGQYFSSKFTVLFSDGSVSFKGEGNLSMIRCVRDNI
jgi:hypothetical protein